MVALETGSAAPWPPFPRECLHSGKSWQQKRRWEQRRSRERGTGSAQPRSTQPSPAQPCSARRGSSRWNTPGRCGRGSVPAAEALALPVAPGARGAAVTLARRWSSAPGLCPSSPGGLGGCSSRVKVRSSERQMHNKRFQKGGFFTKSTLSPTYLFSPHLQFKLWLPCHRQLRICLGRGPGAAARFSFQGSSPGKVTRG